jgi:hypothetical protein
MTMTPSNVQQCDASRAAAHASGRLVEEVESVVIRFAGDSGDGMQLTGMEFSKVVGRAGHDYVTHPDYPSEIRAPEGAQYGVSGYSPRCAALHKGTAFVEILQNCVVFNDQARQALTDRTTRPDAAAYLEHGKPLVFGTGKDKAIHRADWEPKVFTIGQNGSSEADALVHDESAGHGGLAYFLSQLERPAFPVPLGVFRDRESPTYEDLNQELHASARARRGRGTLAQLLNGGSTWTIQ